MNKILYVIIIFMSLVGCKYEPIFLSKKSNFKFNNIIMQGDEKINKIIKNNLLNRSKGNKIYDIHLTTSRDKESISLNEKGDATSYKLKIFTDYKIIENNEIVFKNNFTKQTTYNNITDKFELSKNEENIIENLSKIISSEIIMSVVTINK